ncbi:PTS glucose transporter subunit IIA [Psychrosphaera sp. B3R10]|uniref:PTS glucose transporter subunit IIA n=1 Tax=unclassified Psychrosphaera TaxID=2641570 RepID=UPI001C088332|nr:MULTISPECIES: PTS glucose transporter subunit IIA [unclassified Psychrosphaera]MBU2882218.1 PTS glucose transporter subunit IIA [Psychrosphaera sp. I2R16]MBU2988899.1 PTS glucose transporter subunit IIA [Psychrosphaera sp. B3R10]
MIGQSSKIEFKQGSTVTGVQIPAPISGKVSRISCPLVNQLGCGVSITPTTSQVTAPFNAHVIAIDISIGQIVLQAKNKLKLAIQLPFEYKQNLGLGIKILVKLGQAVTLDQPLMELNLYKMSHNSTPTHLYIFWLNAQTIKRIVVPRTHVEHGADPLFTLVTE